MQFLAYSQISNMKIYQSIQIWHQKYPRVEKGKERVKKDKKVYILNFLISYILTCIIKYIILTTYM